MNYRTLTTVPQTTTKLGPFPSVFWILISYLKTKGFILDGLSFISECLPSLASHLESTVGTYHCRNLVLISRLYILNLLNGDLFR